MRYDDDLDEIDADDSVKHTIAKWHMSTPKL